jgi:hypothetical protein
MNRVLFAAAFVFASASASIAQTYMPPTYIPPGAGYGYAPPGSPYFNYAQPYYSGPYTDWYAYERGAPYNSR